MIRARDIIINNPVQGQSLQTKANDWRLVTVWEAPQVNVRNMHILAENFRSPHGQDLAWLAFGGRWPRISKPWIQCFSSRACHRVWCWASGRPHHTSSRIKNCIYSKSSYITRRWLQVRLTLKSMLYRTNIPALIVWIFPSSSEMSCQGTEWGW